MHAVCLLHAFTRAAKVAGLSDDEIDELVTHVSNHPDAGDEIKGTGGCRKFRWPGRGKGKSGGYRTITFYSGADLPVFLLTVFGKGERSDLSQAERNALRQMTRTLVSEYRGRTGKAERP